MKWSQRITWQHRVLADTSIFRVGHLSVATLPSFSLYCADGFQLNSHRPDSHITQQQQTTFALNVSHPPRSESTNVSSFWSKSTVIQFIVSLTAKIEREVCVRVQLGLAFSSRPTERQHWWSQCRFCWGKVRITSISAAAGFAIKEMMNQNNCGSGPGWSLAPPRPRYRTGLDQSIRLMTQKKKCAYVFSHSIKNYQFYCIEKSSRMGSEMWIPQSVAKTRVPTFWLLRYRVYS